MIKILSLWKYRNIKITYDKQEFKILRFKIEIQDERSQINQYFTKTYSNNNIGLLLY